MTNSALDREVEGPCDDESCDELLYIFVVVCLFGYYLYQCLFFVLLLLFILVVNKESAQIRCSQSHRCQVLLVLLLLLFFEDYCCQINREREIHIILCVCVDVELVYVNTKKLSYEKRNFRNIYFLKKRKKKFFCRNINRFFLFGNYIFLVECCV